MKRPASSLYYTIKESFWFVPAIMALVAACAAIASVALDRSLGGNWMEGMALAWSGGAEGARSVLAVIAGSTMTVVSIVFSITITALAQTSAHFGPRVLRNFTRDRGNQFVLGTFVAAFLFSLLVLRTVRTEGPEPFVPYLSVNLGIALAVLSIAVLIFFIHHIATSIQADLLIARVGEECREAVATMFPQELGSRADGTTVELPARTDAPGDLVGAKSVGYVQSVDDDALFDSARRAQVLVTVLARPGDFVSAGRPLARVAPAGALDENLAHAIRGSFAVGDRRTPEQDIAYSVQQLVEIAARALSPGINEPFTALVCIDYLNAALRSLAGRDAPPPYRKDDSGALRVVAYPLLFPEIVQLSLGMIRRYAGGASDIYLGLLRALRDLASALRREADREALLDEVRQVHRDALNVRNAQDRERVLEQARETRDVLRAATLAGPQGRSAEAAGRRA
ncbi:MAG: DUF2254 domain-containing protein [Burkholderiaceae bacterium]